MTRKDRLRRQRVCRGVFDIQERGRSEGCGGSDVRVWKRSNPSRRMTVSARLEGTPLGLRLLGIFEVHGESRTMEVVTVATGQFCDWGSKKRFVLSLLQYLYLA